MDLISLSKEEKYWRCLFTAYRHNDWQLSIAANLIGPEMLLPLLSGLEHCSVFSSFFIFFTVK